ncbi:MAG: hypothetical protein ABI969_11040, partial [bacterium]
DLPASVESIKPSVAYGPLAIPSRLVVPHHVGAAWYTTPRRPDPFAPPAPRNAVEQDSTLSLLGAEVPWRAARRLLTESERDAAAKEAMLKIRLSGRTLLVPPDNTGGMIRSSIPMPAFGAGPSRTRRAQDMQFTKENQARLERLQARADSMRRSRTDSLATCCALP